MRGDTSLIYPDLNAVRNFPLDAADVIVGGYPKSGTNWLQVIIQQLWPEWGTTAITPRGNVPNISGPSNMPGGYAGYDYCISAAAPRLMKTHLHRGDMPARWPAHGKVIYVTRNPFDVCLSLWHQLRGSERIPDDFEGYFQRFLSGDVLPYDPYVENVLSWHSVQHPNLLHVSYEGAKRDTRPVVNAIVAFLERPATAEQIDDVLQKTQFEAMRSNPKLTGLLNHTRPVDSERPFMRSGRAGEWRSVLTPAQQDRIQATCIAPLAAAGVHVDLD